MPSAGTDAGLGEETPQGSSALGSTLAETIAHHKGGIECNGTNCPKYGADCELSAFVSRDSPHQIITVSGLRLAQAARLACAGETAKKARAVQR